MEIKKVLGEKSYEVSNGTSYSKYILVGVSIDDLMKEIGMPSNIGSGDDKVQLQWVFDLGEGKCLTIYDWKNYYMSINSIREWHVGGNITPEETEKALDHIFNNSNVEWIKDSFYN